MGDGRSVIWWNHSRRWRQLLRWAWTGRRQVLTKSITVRLTLQNLSTQPSGFSLEPYGDYCEMPPDTIVHATWELQPSADLHLEIALTNDAVLVGDASRPLCELLPSRDEPGGTLWS